jgi:hypothetical protein
MPTKKAAARKKPTPNKLDSLSGHDSRNGLVQMNPATKGKVKGYEVIADRTEYSAFHATREAAVKDYNHQINSSQRQ